MLNNGDTIRLKSSDTPMTVSFINDLPSGRLILCTWFDSEGTMQSKSFSESSLVKVSDSEIKKLHKAEAKRKDAKVGATWYDQASKLASLISAIGVVILGIITVLQNSKLSEIETKIKLLMQQKSEGIRIDGK